MSPKKQPREFGPDLLLLDDMIARAEASPERSRLQMSGMGARLPEVDQRHKVKAMEETLEQRLRRQRAALGPEV